uniref:Uncharacterized protein n=1 Tax=Anguilla anguilla TaxID=7936 RepID=A0A0E9Q3Q4_ANGAN
MQLADELMQSLTSTINI